MKFQKGNKLGGRKKLTEEIKDMKETMKEQTIEELATDKVFKQITTLQGRNKKDRQGIKDIALPVYLKSKADKVDLTSLGKSIVYEEEQKRKIADRIIKRGESNTGTGSEESLDRLQYPDQ